jgi:glucose-1-phosphate adenylyltransferase
MGADEYETDEQLEKDCSVGRPPIGVGAGSVIEEAILDKNSRVGANVRIVNEKGVEETPDADDCVVRDGIPAVLKDAVLPDDWKLTT